MKQILMSLGGGVLAGVMLLASMPAGAWWGGDYYRPWYGGGPWYGGYPYYGGYGGYPGYWGGGYPYYGGWGGYPYRGWGYPYGGWGGYPYYGSGWGGYPYAVAPVQPQAETAADK